MRRLVILGILFLATSTPAVAEATQTDQPAFVTKALQLLYGSDAEIGTDKDTGRAFAIWKSTPMINAELFPRAEPQENAISVVNLALPISVGSTKEYLVLTASNPYSIKDKSPANGCHACAATLGGIVLSEQKGVWKADVKTLHIADLGAWGQIPDGQLMFIGPNKYGVRFDFEDTHQGETNDWTVIVGVVGDALAQVLEIATADGNMEGGCAGEQEEATSEGKKFDPKLWCYQYSSDMRFIATDGSGYYDLEVRYTGTNADFNVQVPEGMKITDVSRVETYKWKGSGYKLAKSVKSKTQNAD